MDDLEFAPNLTELVLETLEDFDVVGLLGAGAIIFPSALRDVNGVGDNLQAVSVAATLRLSSVDDARRRYVGTGGQPTEAAAHRNYVQSYKAARAHIDECVRQMTTNTRNELGIGTFAASIALERLRSGFLAAHVLYRLGLNLEGDVVARQVLEQIAWALTASEVVDREKLNAVESSKSIAKLKKLVPEAGRLYGLLSKSAHASYEQHLSAFTTDQAGRGLVKAAWNRQSVSADILLRLADLWVISYEWTQREHMTAFVSLDPANSFRVIAERPFLNRAQRLVDLIVAEESGPS